MPSIARPLTLLLGSSLVALLIGFAAPACSGNPLSPDGCAACDPGEDVYYCDVPSSNNEVCAYDVAQAVGLCDPYGIAGMQTCDQSTGGQSNYPNWDPDSYVYYDRRTGEYVVDPQLITDIASDGAVLFLADDARLVAQSGGYYKFYSISADDLARHLGFQNGDKVMTVNGSYVLQTWADYADAIVNLRYATAFSIVVQRGGSYTTLYYRVQ